MKRLLLPARFALLLCLQVLFPGSLTAEPATLARAAELMKEPASDAPRVATLPENAAVDAGERRGGWIRVRTAAGEEGWVKLLSLRYAGPGAVRQGDTGLAQAVNVARTGTSGTRVTTGVRGLDAEEIANARPNPAELSRLKRFASTREASAAFADAAKLRSQPVDYPQ